MKYLKMYENMNNINNVYVISTYGFDFDEIYLTESDAKEALKKYGESNNGDLVGREIITLLKAINAIMNSVRQDYEQN